MIAQGKPTRVLRALVSPWVVMVIHYIALKERNTKKSFIALLQSYHTFAGLIQDCVLGYHI